MAVVPSSCPALGVVTPSFQPSPERPAPQVLALLATTGGAPFLSPALFSVPWMITLLSVTLYRSALESAFYTASTEGMSPLPHMKYQAKISASNSSQAWFLSCFWPHHVLVFMFVSSSEWTEISNRMANSLFNRLKRQIELQNPKITVIWCGSRCTLHFSKKKHSMKLSVSEKRVKNKSHFSA